MPQVIQHTHEDHQVEFLLQSCDIPYRHLSEFDIDTIHFSGEASLSQIMQICVDPKYPICSAPLHLQGIKTRVATDIQHGPAVHIFGNHAVESSELDSRIVAEKMLWSCLDTLQPQIMEPRSHLANAGF